METTPYVISALEHSAQLFRQTLMNLISGTGVVGATDLEVTEHSPANLSVNIGPGYVIVPGTQGSITGQRANAGSQHSSYSSLQANFTSQGVYNAVNPASITLTLSEANAEHERIDLICASIQDTFYSGSFNQALLQVVTGTPAASPKPPTPPENTVVLAQVAVAAKTTTVKAANITDERPRAKSAAPGTGYAYTGLVERTNEVVYTPSTTNSTYVVLQLRAKGEESAEYILKVAGVTVGQQEIPVNSSKTSVLFGFICPLGVSWEVHQLRGELFSNYLSL